MKSINWVVNGVLAVAVIVLYVLHFNNDNIPIKSAALNGAGTKVAYFEIDSIQNSYEFFKEVKSALQLKDMENASLVELFIILHTKPITKRQTSLSITNIILKVTSQLIRKYVYLFQIH